MNGVRHILATKHLDGPFDLAPAAEMDDVAEGSAAVRAVGGLDHRQFAIFRDQRARFQEGGPISNMNIVSQVNRPYS